MLYPKIGFIGLGLIGGSIAKIIKEKYPETEMIAIASRESTIQAAYADGIITNDTMLDLEAFADCDFYFYAVRSGSMSITLPVWRIFCRLTVSLQM